MGTKKRIKKKKIPAKSASDSFAFPMGTPATCQFSNVPFLISNIPPYKYDPPEPNIEPSPYAVPRSVESRELSAEIDGRRYCWGGGFGSVITSDEDGVKVGDTRNIGGVLFHCASVEGGGWFCRSTVHWTIPNDHISSEWMRDFRKKFAGC